MSVSIVSLASGSKGNSTLVFSDDTAILVMRTAQAAETLCDEIHEMMR